MSISQLCLIFFIFSITSWVNQHLAITPVTPFGGSKWSGIGRENGKWGLSAFLEPFTLNIIIGGLLSLYAIYIVNKS